MFGLRPAVPVSVFTPRYLIKSCEHDTKMGAGKREKAGEGEREKRHSASLRDL